MTNFLLRMSSAINIIKCILESSPRDLRTISFLHNEKTPFVCPVDNVTIKHSLLSLRSRLLTNKILFSNRTSIRTHFTYGVLLWLFYDLAHAFETSQNYFLRLFFLHLSFARQLGWSQKRIILIYYARQ